MFPPSKQNMVPTLQGCASMSYQVLSSPTMSVQFQYIIVTQ